MEHHKLDAYNVALDFAPRAHIWPAASRAVSATSPINFAEGAGEYSPKDKAKFYRFAKRSAAECSAILEIALSRIPVSRQTRTRSSLSG